MKILYISPENTVGTMTLWKEIHQKNGNECDEQIKVYNESGFDGLNLFLINNVDI